MMNMYINRDPDILGGEPVITGTRIPVIVILQFLKEGYTLEEVQEMYPHVTIESLQGVLDELATGV